MLIQVFLCHWQLHVQLMVKQSYFGGYWVCTYYPSKGDMGEMQRTRAAACTLVLKKISWCGGQFLQVFGSATVAIDIHGEILQVAVVVIDLLTTEAILGLDVLSQHTVDLLHRTLITDAGHVVTLCCQEPNMERAADLLDVGTTNNDITVNSDNRDVHRPLMYYS